jgi:hypothetical protein
MTRALDYLAAIISAAFLVGTVAVVVTESGWNMAAGIFGTAAVVAWAIIRIATRLKGTTQL